MYNVSLADLWLIQVYENKYRLSLTNVHDTLQHGECAANK